MHYYQATVCGNYVKRGTRRFAGESSACYNTGMAKAEREAIDAIPLCIEG